MKVLFFAFAAIYTGLISFPSYGQSTDAQKNYEKGVKAFEKGDYEKAMEHFVEAIEASEDFVESTFQYLGKSYYELQKQYDGVTEEVDMKEEAPTEEDIPIEEEVTVPVSQKKKVAADPILEPNPKEYDSFITSDRIAANSAYQGGVAAYKQKDFVSAIQYFTIVIEANEGNMENAFNYRGMSYHALGDYGAAIADYDSTIELDESSYIAYHNRGIAKQNSKLYNEALIDFNKTIQLKPSYSRAYESRAVLYYKMRDLEKALKDCEKILQIDADNENALKLKEKLEEENK